MRKQNCQRSTFAPCILWIVILIGALLGFEGWSCTTFVMKSGDEVYFARNLDWTWENGLIIVNQRNIQKKSLTLPGEAGANWISKYGSVTFNQFGREMPYGGINEVGLVVECMWLDKTEYAPMDARHAINLLQWIQYQLDNCRTVDEVLATDADLRVYAPNHSARIHYLICDSQGQSATVEFLRGKMVAHRGADLPFATLANDTYDQSVEYARIHLNDEHLWDRSSLARFARACLRSTEFKPGDSATNIQYAFKTLDEVAQGNTVWSIVYAASAGKIFYRTRGNPRTRVVNLADLSFSPSGHVQFVNVTENPGPDGAWKFRDLSEQEHRKYLELFVTDPSVRDKFGDLMPQVYGQFEMLRGFHPVEVIPGR
jgi:penicillin V acylase-like amidase (Ntn superfamily)